MGDINKNKCNHRIKSRNTSIIILDSQKTFTYPEHIYGVCECCGKSFHYIKDEKYIRKKLTRRVINYADVRRNERST